jgi:hypothetical protein
VSVREYREIEARRALAELGDVLPDLRAVRLAADVRWIPTVHVMSAAEIVTDPTALDITTLVIAVIGLAAALLSLGWQVASWMLSGPRVR